jgi:GAF domain-containing protein
LALKQHAPIITEDLAQAEADLQAAQSIVAQRLRAGVVVIPLYFDHTGQFARVHDQPAAGDFLGVLYLDSRRPAAFSKLDRQILDALAADAASILDNARLVERERERPAHGAGNQHCARHPAGIAAERIFASSHTWQFPDATSRAFRWGAITSMCFR